MPTSYRNTGEPVPAEHGAVTAEFAVVLPAVIAVLALVLGACAVGVSHIKLEEAARLAARAAARGETPETVERIATEAATDAEVTVTENDGKITVVTSKEAPGVIGNLTGWILTAEAVTPAEESAP